MTEEFTAVDEPEVPAPALLDAVQDDEATEPVGDPAIDKDGEVE